MVLSLFSSLENTKYIVTPLKNPIGFHHGGFRKCTVMCSSAHPTIKSFKREHPCPIHWAKLSDAWNHVVQQVDTHNLACSWENLAQEGPGLHSYPAPASPMLPASTCDSCSTLWMVSKKMKNVCLCLGASIPRRQYFRMP